MPTVDSFMASGPFSRGCMLGGGGGSPLEVLAPEQLAGRLPKVADLILHRLALPAFGGQYGQSACQSVHKTALLGASSLPGRLPNVPGRLPKLADLVLHSLALPAHDHFMVCVQWLLVLDRPGALSCQGCWEILSFLICPLFLSFHCFTDKSAKKSRRGEEKAGTQRPQPS